MTEKTPTTDTPVAAVKASWKDRFRKSPNEDGTPKTKSAKDKVQKGLAVVGGVTIAAVVISQVAKKRGIESVTVEPLDVDVTTSDDV